MVGVIHVEEGGGPAPQTLSRPARLPTEVAPRAIHLPKSLSSCRVRVAAPPRLGEPECLRYCATDGQVNAAPGRGIGEPSNQRKYERDSSTYPDDRFPRGGAHLTRVWCGACTAASVRGQQRVQGALLLAPRDERGRRSPFAFGSMRNPCDPGVDIQDPPRPRRARLGCALGVRFSSPLRRVDVSVRVFAVRFRGRAKTSHQGTANGRANTCVVPLLVASRRQIDKRRCLVLVLSPARGGQNDFMRPLT